MITKILFAFIFLDLFLVSKISSASSTSLHETYFSSSGADRVTTQDGRHDVSQASRSPDTSSFLVLQSASHQRATGASESASMTMSAFRYIPKQGFDEDAVFCGLANSPVKRALADGRVFLPGNKVLRLPMPKDYFLDWISVQSDGSSLFIGYEVNSGGDGSAGLCKFRLPDGQRSWCAPPYFSFHEGAVSRSGHIYIAGSDTVTKFDAGSGKVMWRTANLMARKMAYGIFTTPVEDADGIAFHSWSGTAVMRTLVDQQNGRVISVKKYRAGSVVPLRSARVEGKCTN